jgi:hypothetical protein
VAFWNVGGSISLEMFDILVLGPVRRSKRVNGRRNTDFASKH